MVSGASKKKKKKAAAAAASSSLASPPPPPPPSLTEADLAPRLARVHAHFTQEMQEKHSINLKHTEDKGRVCLAPPQGPSSSSHAIHLRPTHPPTHVPTQKKGFEPGRVLLEEKAYLYGNGTKGWCLECDAPTHPSSHCPLVLSTYPPTLPPLLDEMEDYMEGLERVESLDRARSWIKVGWVGGWVGGWIG